ncbi:MAG: EAL domain-containing protein [Burkholderiaceae bacterium]|jgi:diguanylate cyclase (GGDEF)-like protein/PAS domain S-box-containing protein
MNLDLQSVGLTSAIFLTAVAILALVVSREAKNSVALDSIGLGTLAVGLGLLALSLRHIIPTLVSMLAGDTCFVAGFLFLDRGCRRFYGDSVKASPWIWSILPAQALALLIATYGIDDQALRVEIVAATGLLVCGRWAAFMAHGRAIGDPRLPNRLLAFAPWILIGLFAAVLLRAGSEHRALTTLQAGGWVLLAGTFIICAVVSGVALIMLWLEAHVELHKSIERTGSILRVLPDIITIQDRNGQYLEVQEPQYRSHSLRNARVMERGLRGAFSPEVVRARLGCILEALNTGELQVMEYPLALEDKTVWLEARVIPYQRDKVLTLVRDVTERKMAERVHAEAEATLRLISENMGDMIALYNSDGTFRYISPSTKKLLGYDPAELLGLSPFQVIHPEDAALARRGIERVLDGVTQAPLQYRIRNKAGDYIWMEVRGQPIWGAQQKPESYITSATDITERRAIEEQLRFAALVARNASEAIVVTSAEGSVQWVNDAFIAMTGYSRDEATNTLATRLINEGGDTAELRSRTHVLREQGRWEGETTATRKTGEVFPVWHRISAVRNERGAFTHFVHVISDRSREQQTQQIIEHLSRHDTLTKLPNRAHFVQALTEAIAKASQDPARMSGLALLSMNLDRFKRLNGLLGQADGDRLLQRIAQRLVTLLDPIHAIVARVAGDEFVILMTSLSTSVEAGHAARDVMETLAKPFDLGFEDDVFVTTSIGISVYPEDGTTADAIMKASTTAMYHAKRAGGNAYRFFSVEMDSRDAGQLLTEARLRRAAESKEGMSMAYQPKLALPQRRITGVEALIRWHHTDAGDMAPVQFIPLAEDLGLIQGIGEWVLRTVCTEAVERQKAGFEPLRIAVNLSAKQLIDESLPDKIQAILDETGMEAGLLELEVTETCVMTARDQAARLLERLREIGISLCLDDFGTGHSSLSYLSSLPVDSIKIDRSFVSGLPFQQTSVAICKAVLAMGGALGLKIVAEGVEREDEFEFLEVHGCDELQGNLIGVPMSDQALRQFLLTRARSHLQQA